MKLKMFIIHSIGGKKMLRDLKKIITSFSKNNERVINDIRLPLICEKNCNYITCVKNSFHRLLSELEKPALNSIKSDINEICDQILEAFEAILSANIEKCDQILKELLSKYMDDTFYVSELDKSYAFRGIAYMENLQIEGYDETYNQMKNGELSFFRGRTVKLNNKNINHRSEMVHLPYSMIDKSQNMRFSEKGCAGLYLGVTSWVCAKECRWDSSAEDFYVSGCHFNEKGKKLKILNLCVSQALINGAGNFRKDNNIHKKMLKIFPLIIATSVTIGEKDRCIKYEYLLSQRLMHVINQKGIDGIAYLSCQENDEFDYPHGVCLAFPINDINEQKQYGDLCNCFEMTKPIKVKATLEKKTGKKSYILRNYPKYENFSEISKYENFSSKIYENGDKVSYQDTMYSNIDEYIEWQSYTYYYNE